ncbi:glyoxylase-like metal-dependent hydrolase (beta-lactamase superfamily II) [Kibdelosporangium banguiense]|uniref:Glyoxylase-like metal-dependent hydrolase (Beta-lactamase superfamily II) n=1 Tax=Kibdelosporangium banguiense TaxID=1365924 RepID=A0ABS4TVU2_9PSEU|nr:MBL fold metallo-hydrolase [Kibdelosporangium banguiense]MBP2328089.1 glyoxylase-like metal-dependent hydrolase (beta-lactamase superfamily II) [Kibdelosporangium banguiense]
MKLLTFRTTTHQATPASIGTPVNSAAMEDLLGRPGPIELRTIGADWEANLSGLLNIKDPKAIQAGIKERKEPIQIYTHVVRHPTQGFFLVDTGVSRRLVEDPTGVGVGWMLKKFGGIDKMRPQQSTSEIIEAEGAPLKGVFMTHLHLDHVSGFPDIAQDVPIYTGADEAEASLFLNMFAQGTNNHLLNGRPALQELQFTKDPDGKLEGVNDVFGDGSFYAILTPGHTMGHVSYLARTTTGPVLMTGDVSHTRWGWENDVEPGTFLAERQRSRESLLALKALSKRHPKMTVKLGHQP